MNAKEIAEILLEIKAVALRPSEPFRYASGILSPIYTDNRLLMGYGVKRKAVFSAMAALLKEKGIEFDLVAGTATAGIPHAAWLAEDRIFPLRATVQTPPTSTPLADPSQSPSWP